MDEEEVVTQEPEEEQESTEDSADSPVADPILDPIYKVVLRRFYGEYWHQSGEIVEVSGWRTAAMLEAQRYLRPLLYGEEPYTADDGTKWVTEGAAKFAGAPVASSETSPDVGPQADESGDVDLQGSPASEEEVGEGGDGEVGEEAPASDEGEGTEDESQADEAAESEASAEDGSSSEDENAEDGAEDALAEDTRSTAKHSYEVVEIGGGWYNVHDEHGAVLNSRALHGKTKARAFMEEQE